MKDDVSLTEAQRVIAESILTELELGMTFLDVAQNTKDRKHALRSVRNAITAARTADAFLRRIHPTTKIDEIHKRREQLAERLRAIANADHSSDSP